jgi:flagellar hook-associated protein 2
MASITAGGIGSGLDITSLVAQLVSAEGAPAKARLDRQEQKVSAQLSALGFLRSSLSSLRDSLSGLADQSAFRAMSAVSSHESVVVATAGDGAQPGQYQIEVLRLAQRHKLGSATFESTQTFGGSVGDTLAVATGAWSFNLDLSTAKTLSGIRDAINSSAGNPGVAATLLQVDATHQVLVLSAADTGQAHAISLTETLASGPPLSFSMTNLNASGQPLTDTALLDAAFRIDGIAMTRPSNQITDVIDELTIDLRQAEPGTLASLELGPDLESITKAVSEFVTRYNAFIDTLSQVAGFRGVGVEQPPLFGDAAARGIAFRVRDELARDLGGPEGTVSALFDIGIRGGKNGKLTLDNDILAASLARDSSGVVALFGAEDGVAKRLDRLIDSYLESGGVFDTRNKGLQGRLDRIEDSRESLERRLSGLEARYLQQFTAMDVLVGQLQATSTFLTQQLSALTNNTT